jgi:hypothetical protein
MDELLDAVVQELCDRHGCHTVILYGSHARGDANPESDVDLLGIRAEGPAYRDARPWRGTFLDAFIQPESDFAAPNDEQLKLLGGRVLVEQGDVGTRLLAAVDAVYAAGPRKQAAHERAVTRSWLEKTLHRIARGDLEGHYRRVMLLYQALEDYFTLRDRWYLGPKAAFAWMRQQDPETYRRFEEALAPGADLAAIRAMVEAVLAT